MNGELTCEWMEWFKQLIWIWRPPIVKQRRGNKHFSIATASVNNLKVSYVSVGFFLVISGLFKELMC